MLLFILPSDCPAEYSDLTTSVRCLCTTSAMPSTHMEKAELFFFLENHSHWQISPAPLTTTHWLFLPTKLSVSAQPAAMQGTYNMTVIPSWLCSQNTLISMTHHPSVTTHHVVTHCKFYHLTPFAVEGWKLSTFFKVFLTLFFCMIILGSQEYGESILAPTLAAHMIDEILVIKEFKLFLFFAILLIVFP